MLKNRVLTDTGMPVLEDHWAFLEVDGTGFGCALLPETAVWQMVVDIAQATVMIWNVVKHIKPKREWES
jgi:hypothetical protein